MCTLHPVAHPCTVDESTKHSCIISASCASCDLASRTSAGGNLEDPGIHAIGPLAMYTDVSPSAPLMHTYVYSIGTWNNRIRTHMLLRISISIWYHQRYPLIVYRVLPGPEGQYVCTYVSPSAPLMHTPLARGTIGYVCICCSVSLSLYVSPAVSSDVMDLWFRDPVVPEILKPPRTPAMYIHVSLTPHHYGTQYHYTTTSCIHMGCMVVWYE